MVVHLSRGSKQRPVIFKSTAHLDNIVLLDECHIGTCIVSVAPQDGSEAALFLERPDIRDLVLSARWVRACSAGGEGGEPPLPRDQNGLGVLFLFDDAHSPEDLARFVCAVDAIRDNCCGDQSLTIFGPELVEISMRKAGTRSCRALIFGGLRRRKSGQRRGVAAGDPSEFDPVLLAAAFSGATAVRIAPVGELHQTEGRRGRPVDGEAVVRVHTYAKLMPKWFAVARQYAPRAEITVPHKKRVRYRAHLRRSCRVKESSR